ncbi:hypothetical protein K0M31_017485 [Melipona bicolor]|uniref:Ig-like domain-containing protein n=1 Tax=Melipona bicolor TaxID=60889 RepID=A0AA40G4Y5_9HYME|nr:hypothetical protein K0M31_017485 [Melipona bicolor]
MERLGRIAKQQYRPLSDARARPDPKMLSQARVIFSFSKTRSSVQGNVFEEIYVGTTAGYRRDLKQNSRFQPHVVTQFFYDRRQNSLVVPLSVSSRQRYSRMFSRFTDTHASFLPFSLCCRWYYNRNQREEPVEDSAGHYVVRDGSLIVQGVQESDAGSYMCTSSNSEGSESMEVRLTVSAPLSVHVQPSIQTVDLGKVAHLTCSASGFPQAALYWLKDGQPLRTGARIRAVSRERISVMSVAREDRGMYQCFVRNEYEMAQGIAELRLGEIAPQLVYRFIEQTMQTGPSVSLKCSAAGNPTPQISWLLDGFPLPQNDRLLIGQYVTVYGDVISHVNISSVKSEDGGEYECIASSRAGEASHSARLNIYGEYFPYGGLPYVRPMSTVSAVAGKQFHIKCPVAGYPIESIVWEKDGVRLPTNMRQRVANGSLFIDTVQRAADQGTYTCTARNKHNFTSQRSVEVRVLGQDDLICHGTLSSTGHVRYAHSFSFLHLHGSAGILMECILM